MGRLRRIVGFVCTGLVLLLAVLYFSPIVPRMSTWLMGQWGEPKGDVLIVLGADQLGDGTLGMVSYWRSVYAVRAYRQGGFHRVVISGGRMGYPNTPSLAREMGDFIAALGVPKDSITLEERSLTTRQNALFTAAIVQGWPGKKVLLTSDCHMRRARAAFARAGVETSPAPIPDIGKRWYDLMLRWDCIWTVGFETVKYVYYDLHGWI
jgi:uncharacterized SAM-binding protein YcdF (DUF218 family)